MKDDSKSESAIVTPYLAVKDASRAIEFYRAAFGAVEVYRLDDVDGRVSHAELRIGGAAVLISDEYPEIGVNGPLSLGGSAVMIVLEVPDLERVFEQAVAAGAIVARPIQGTIEDEFRNGKLVDPFGHRWMVLTRKKALNQAPDLAAGENRVNEDLQHESPQRK